MVVIDENGCKVLELFGLKAPKSSGWSNLCGLAAVMNTVRGLSLRELLTCRYHLFC